MSLTKPYPHIYRHGSSRVIEPYVEARRESFAVNSFASYEILKQDLKKMFEYIEPCTDNYKVYSHRTFELLVRACIEVESLCKLVFSVNKVKFGKKPDIIRYSDLETVMQLSFYKILCPGFHLQPFCPFSSFSSSVRRERSPVWYRAYNDVKHSRAEKFSSASLENVIQAIAGIHVLLVAQYGEGVMPILVDAGTGDQFQGGELFLIESFPKWPLDEKYDYNWARLKEKFPNPEERYDYLYNLPERPNC